MDPVLIGLIILAVIALGGWGYGTYGMRPVPGAATEVVAAPAWASPLGVIGLLVVVGVVIMLLSGWRFVVVP
jgi:hypothetical protein